MSTTTSVKASDPGSAWFGSGARTAPSSSSSSGGGIGGHNARLITTAVAAFVSVLGLALFLHLYVCHVRRRNRRRAAEAAAALPITSPAAAKAGLDPTAIAALPTAVYANKAEDGECAICLGAVAEGEVVRALPACGHVFHVPCVDTWLASSSSCPVCRAEVEPPQEDEEVIAAARLVQEKLQDAVKEEAGSCSSTPERGISACASLMKMLSRERPAAPRRPQQSAAAVHADAGELDDLERQLHAVNNN
ncbi:hypothetical protein HU200_007812 [Digitaria exilis]|uniref:RING-type E3 ubiquitin transferase n=1 Tax=Digitaria exilis TaxID=1010633 RepID=A0A835FQB8_9POAL|nr:hypothetical protein HU200_007812 [Digitaria exilis]CAB3474291.1 unnamed protein product [Digitaria exilis]